MKVMSINGSVDDMKRARAALGRPAAFDEAIVATGIDALFVLLDGGVVEIEGAAYRLAALDGEGDT